MVIRALLLASAHHLWSYLLRSYSETSAVETPWLLFFYVLLTVHLSIILVINQFNAQILVL